MKRDQQSMQRLAAFGERFRYACEQKGIKTTQRALGHFFGVSEITARAWWRGEAWPGMDNAIHIASSLDVEVEWLLTGRARMTPTRQDETSLRSVPLLALDDVPHADACEQGVYSEEYVPAPPSAGLSAVGFAVRLNDNSMTASSGRSLPAGSIIYVDPRESDEDAKRPERFLLAQTNSGETIFRRHAGNYLEPLNPQYPVEKAATTYTIGIVRSALIDL